jgi:hypothetical protein
MRRLAVLLALSGCFAAPGLSPRILTISSFESDATPPLGHRLVGWSVQAESVEAPLLLKGIVLGDQTSRYVLCALDWCRLQTGAYDLLRRALAGAAGIPETQVALQCTHTHGAPIADADAERLLEREAKPPVHLDLAFLRQVADRAQAALRESLGKAVLVTHVGYGRAKVERYASTRRVPDGDGRVKSRMSSCKDAALVAADEGLVDPWVRTVTFFCGEEPLARLHYYATHPQSHYGKEISPDVPGFVRSRLEREERLPHLYFTGCGGNVAAGKYNDGSAGARDELVRRLWEGIQASIRSTRRAPATALEWKTAGVRFAQRTEPAFLEEGFRKQLADPEESPANRLKAALVLAWYDRLKTRPEVDCSRLRMGPITILHLPGEAFVEYQLYAQSLRPDEFVAVAAYGEGGPGYICMDRSPAEGGYEPTASYVGPPTESRLKDAIADLVR